MEINTSFDKCIDDNIYIQTSKNITIIFPLQYNQINNVKCRIDEENNEWDKMKKVTNPYELIHVSYNNEKKNNSIARYIPLSRSYFKMLEMIIDYGLLNNLNDTIVTASLAEGPGGFMEAIYNERKRNLFPKNIQDKLYGITLPPTNKYIPGWKKINDRLNNFRISYGNLYNIHDIKTFSKKFVNDKAYLVTSDGGFDYSIDFNNQEQLSYRIIFCEIITALSIQKEGGHFVCKIFDIFTLFTLKMIYLLYCFYEKVYIVKPKTSRTANSEKYIIAKGFKGIDKKYLNKFYKIIEDWDKLNNYVSNIEGININNDFIHWIYKYNESYIENQIKYINLTIEYTQTRPEKELYRKIVKQQINNALSWCSKYGIEINKASRFLNYQY